MFRGDHARLIPQRSIHRSSIYNFSRIENIVRIPGVLDPTKKLVVIFPNHHGNKRCSYPSVPVLPAEGAFVFFHQLGRSFGDFVKLLHIFLFFEVQNGTHVDFPSPGMGIVNRILVEPTENFIKFVDVVRQILNIHRSIFNTGYGLGIPWNISQQTQSSCTKRPSGCYMGRFYNWIGITVAGFFEVSNQGLPFSQGFFQSFATELYHKNRFGISLHKIPVFAVFNTFFGTVQNDFIHQFHCRHLMLHGHLCGLHALMNGLKMGGHHNFHRIRQRIQKQFDLRGQSQGTLRTRKQLAEVERFSPFFEEL